MFCPNCGVENGLAQNYCRSCGLKLDAILEVVSEQFPSKEYAAFQRRKEVFAKLGVGSLSIAALIAIAYVLTKVALYKLILLGPEVLFGSAAAALIGFLLLSVFFFNYPKLFMKFEPVKTVRPDAEKPVLSSPTNKLIDDRPFEPVPSVTEDSTELLANPRQSRRSE
jgi:hypothetical protein